jgi:hypothetical protein
MRFSRLKVTASRGRHGVGPPAVELWQTMRVESRPVLAEKVRKVPKSFSWVDHRLVRDGHIDGRSHAALALYLFLVTVGDSRGLSYWSQNAVARRLRLNLTALTAARGELAAAGLVAYEEPMWQVLELPGGAA